MQAATVGKYQNVLCVRCGQDLSIVHFIEEGPWALPLSGKPWIIAGRGGACSFERGVLHLIVYVE